MTLPYHLVSLLPSFIVTFFSLPVFLLSCLAPSPPHLVFPLIPPLPHLILTTLLPSVSWSHSYPSFPFTWSLPHLLPLPHLVPTPIPTLPHLVLMSGATETHC